jgi:hypothetical protein
MEGRLRLPGSLVASIGCGTLKSSRKGAENAAGAHLSFLTDLENWWLKEE